MKSIRNLFLVSIIGILSIYLSAFAAYAEYFDPGTIDSVSPKPELVFYEPAEGDSYWPLIDSLYEGETHFDRCLSQFDWCIDEALETFDFCIRNGGSHEHCTEQMLDDADFCNRQVLACVGQGKGV